MRHKQHGVRGSYYNIEQNRVLDFTDLDEGTNKEYNRLGMETVSEGKLGVIINFSGFCENLGLPLPKALYSNMMPGNISVIEYLIRKVKAVGQHAIKKVGKHNTLKRDPILIMIQTNERNHDIIDAFLVNKKYFNYQGVIAFSSVSVYS